MIAASCLRRTEPFSDSSCWAHVYHSRRRAATDFTLTAAPEHVQQLYTLIQQKQRKSVQPSAPEQLLPLVSLSQLMLDIPLAVKASVRQGGGLLNTLRQYPALFACSPNGLEVGIAGQTKGDFSVNDTSRSRPLGTSEQDRRSAPSGGGQHGGASPPTIGQRLKPVLVQLNQRMKQQQKANPASLGSAPRINGTMFVCQFGSIDLNVPPLKPDDIRFAQRMRGYANGGGENWVSSGPQGDAYANAQSGGQDGSNEGRSGIPSLFPESYYRDRGYLTPQEVADLYAPFTPTFPIEIKILMRNLPPDLKDPIMNPHRKKFVKPQDYLKRYPGVFTIKGGKYRTTTVQLAEGLVHKAKGKADRYLQRFRLDRSPKSPGEVRDDEISDLIQHQLEAHPNRGAAFIRLVDFINSFPKEAIENLNRDPPERVIAVIQRRPHLFQLRGTGLENEYFDGAQDEEADSNTPLISAAVSAKLTSPVISIEKPAVATSTATPTTSVVGSGDDVPDKDLEGAINDACALDLKEDTKIDWTADDAEVDPEAAGSAGEKLGDVDDGADADEEGGADDGGEEVDGGEGEEGELSAAHSPQSSPTGAPPRTPDGLPAKPASPVATADGGGSASSGGALPPGVSDYFIRLRPAHLAPSCLSNYGLNDSPQPQLLQAILTIVRPPEIRKLQPRPAPPIPTAPTQLHLRKPMTVSRSGGSLGGIPTAPSPPVISQKVASQEVNPSVLSLRRWVALETLYESLSPALRKELRPFRGLASFLRLHGKLFHVSLDKSHVIAHVPDEPPPFLATAPDGDRVAVSMKGAVLGNGQTPTNRMELMAMDPTNALLDPQTLCEEIHRLLPDHPVSLVKLMKKLPPIMKAAVPSRPIRLFSNSPLFSTWMPSPGNFLIQKAELGPPPQGFGVKESAKLEETIEVLREHIPPGGVPFIKLRNAISPAARNTIRVAGGIDRFLASYPQYFVIDESVKARPIVHLVEHFEGVGVDGSGGHGGGRKPLTGSNPHIDDAPVDW
jgi:hypothetical protein